MGAGRDGERAMHQPGGGSHAGSLCAYTLSPASVCPATRHVGAHICCSEDSTHHRFQKLVLGLSLLQTLTDGRGRGDFWALRGRWLG